ncbi:MAG: B12-binding domain-containing radical SAM protein [Deltaproteobacteria bacterium]|nr:B12-binding domain-containing radical SAM protein [Deltaproteobacteria bacterium]
MSDVLLINPAFSKTEEKKHFPTGLGMIGAGLKKNEISYSIFDCDTVGLYDEKAIYNKIQEVLTQKSPRIVGLTGFWVQYPFLKELSLLIKKEFSDIKIIAGGYWAFQAPEVVLRNTGVDYIIHGEGDEITPELVKCLLEGDDVCSLAGVSRKEGDDIVIYDGPNIFVKELDKLGHPDYDSFKMDYYISSLSRSYLYNWSYLTKEDLDSKFGSTDPLRNITINSARGCIGRCAFCSASTQRYRKFSNQYIIDYIKHLQERFNIQSVNFSDSLSFVNRKQTEEFCEAVLKEKLNIIFHVIVRTDVDYTRETIRLLKRAGCYDLVFGMESANEKICNEIMGKKIDIDRAGELFDMCREEKLHTRVTFIFNMPGETEQQAWDTIRFIRRHRLERGGVYYANPLPKTRLYDMAKDGGFIGDEEAYYEYNPGLDKGVSDFQRYINSFKFNKTPNFLVEGFSQIAGSYYSLNYYRNHHKRLNPRYIKAWLRLLCNYTKYYLYKAAVSVVGEVGFLARMQFCRKKSR